MPRKRQALILEDDAVLTSELESLLERLGFDVTRIQEPDCVEETIGNHVYEVALLNATLPDLSWRRTLRVVKNASRTTTVIMITRHAGEEDIRVALNAGAYAAVERPLSQQSSRALSRPSATGCSWRCVARSANPRLGHGNQQPDPSRLPPVDICPMVRTASSTAS